MAVSRSFQRELTPLRQALKRLEDEIRTPEERRALGRLLANRLAHLALAVGKDSDLREGDGVNMLAHAAETVLRGRPAPNAVLSHILAAIKELDLIK